MIIKNAREFNIESNHKDFKRFNFGLERLIVFYVAIYGISGFIFRGIGLFIWSFQTYFKALKIGDYGLILHVLFSSLQIYMVYGYQPAEKQESEIQPEI